MSAHLVIDIPPHEDALPVGDPAVHTPRPCHRLGAPEPYRHELEDLRLDEFLPERHDLLLSGDSEKVSFATPHRVDRSRDEVTGVDGVGIGEKDYRAGRCLRPGAACPLLAEPAFREGRVRWRVSALVIEMPGGTHPERRHDGHEHIRQCREHCDEVCFHGPKATPGGSLPTASRPGVSSSPS